MKEDLERREVLERREAIERHEAHWNFIWNIIKIYLVIDFLTDVLIYFFW